METGSEAGSKLNDRAFPTLSAAEQAVSVKSALHFDVLSVLRECCAAARPGSAPLAPAPSSAQIYDFVAVLHNADKRKMLLRFHPDRLQHMLARSPTEAEVAMANLAMSAVNLMFEGGAGNDKSLLSALKELDALRSPSVKADVNNDLSKLLASIKVNRLFKNLTNSLRTLALKPFQPLDLAQVGKRHRDDATGNAGGRDERLRRRRGQRHRERVGSRPARPQRAQEGRVARQRRAERERVHARRGEAGHGRTQGGLPGGDGGADRERGAAQRDGAERLLYYKI
ncbi:hypothetical protein T492DRAFT_848483 [Pavlovales sp. CCMP2436]|nr:hypothetical protein T492DRAFT_848483 [Pavlovales sp. CCMP2436]